jgi:hypothetical protein
MYAKHDQIAKRVFHLTCQLPLSAGNVNEKLHDETFPLTVNVVKLQHSSRYVQQLKEESFLSLLVLLSPCSFCHLELGIFVLFTMDVH